jgi:hypothetical protein
MQHCIMKSMVYYHNQFIMQAVFEPFQKYNYFMQQSMQQQQQLQKRLPSKSTTIRVVGDIHVCYDEFQILIKKAVLEQSNGKDCDYIVSVGDMVIKGPNDVNSVQRLIGMLYKGIMTILLFNCI